MTKTNQQRLATIAEEPLLYPICTVIRKKIGQTLQRGTVTRYDEDIEYYWINYENGDSEEMRHIYVTKYKCTEPHIIRKKIESYTTTTTLNKWNKSSICNLRWRNRKNYGNLRLKKPLIQKRKEWDILLSNEYGISMKDIEKRKAKVKCKDSILYNLYKKTKYQKGER